ncbi:MAG: hypothetical protein QNJ64_11945 [Crocosphaera sp.]|nr:hypothetical protein [Crocosphaera sp.]
MEIVDLRDWKEESYKIGSVQWELSDNGEQVVQSKNGDPTFFYSDFTVFKTKIFGKIIVKDSQDNDFIGFALGFNPGDTKNPNANYILIDWKQRNQLLYGSAKRGLAASLVTGNLSLSDIWTHTGKLTELSRGKTLGNKGWQPNFVYKFDFVYTPTNLQVFVNGQLEIDTQGNFTDGRVAFYNFSQENVIYKVLINKIFPSGQFEVPATLETGIKFPNPLAQEEAKVKFIPSGTWSVKKDTMITSAGEKGAKLFNNVAYPQNTPYCLIAVDEVSDEVIAELDTEKIITIKAGQTIIFKMNEEPGWYWDNQGSITVDWTVVE